MLVSFVRGKTWIFIWKISSHIKCIFIIKLSIASSVYKLDFSHQRVCIPSTGLSVSVSLIILRLSVCHSVHGCLCVCLSVSLSVSISVCVSASLSLCLSVCLYIYICIYIYIYHSTLCRNYRCWTVVDIDSGSLSTDPDTASLVIK